MSKKAKIIVSFLLAITIVFSSVSFIYANNTEAKTESSDDIITRDYKNHYNKLHFYLPVIGDRNNRFDYIENSNMLNAAIKNCEEYCLLARKEELIITVQFKSDYFDTAEYKSFCNGRSTIATKEDALKQRRELNSFSKEYHKKLNENNISLLDGIEYVDLNIIEYAPFVSLTIKAKDLSARELRELSENSNIANISIDRQRNISENATWDQTLQAIKAYNIVHYGYYTGEGVNIGVFESDGVCDTTHTNLSGKNITIDSASSLISPHATEVTSIIALMAPDANYYVSSNHFRYGLQWFIDNNCNIVNCSFGLDPSEDTNLDGIFEFSTPTYNYGIDGLYDYQIRANKMTVTVSAGNVETDNTNGKYNPDGYITSPGLAHNVITVGGLERHSTWLSYYLDHHSSACYKTQQITPKPEISAVYEVAIPNIIGNKTGTSYCAPQVAGAAALFMDKYNAYLNDANMVRSNIIKSSNKTHSYTNDILYFDNEVGSGSLDLAEMNGTINGTFILGALYQNNPNSIIWSQNINLSKNNTFQAALSWYSETIIQPSTSNINNYDLELVDPDGIIVFSSLNNSSVEFIRYTVPKSGTYTLRIYQRGNMITSSGEDCIVLTYS